jgi:plasmid stabilization system protein ParE
MSRKIRISRPARRDLDEIWFFIAQDSLAAADGFVVI